MGGQIFSASRFGCGSGRRGGPAEIIRRRPRQGRRQPARPPARIPNERLALLFRDWLPAHPESIPAYARFKRDLARAVADTGTYAEVKDPVVDLVSTVAESWADATGWTPHAEPSRA